MSFGKKLLKALGVVTLFFLLLLLGLFIFHRFKLRSYRDLLAEKNLFQPVSAGDHSLNLVSYGGNPDGQRIIAMGGNGAGFPLELRQLASLLGKEHQVYYLARAGYDGSDDVKAAMTVDYVVEDYRRALQNAGIPAPYVLMPHSYAGILATYWESKYPDEIAAMVDLDGLPARKFTAAQKQMMREDSENPGVKVLPWVIRFGIGDLAMHAFFPADPDLSEEEQRLQDAMMLLTAGSDAFTSELLCAMENIEETWQIMRKNDIPKLYIAAENGYETLAELQAADVLSQHRIQELTPDFTGSDAARRDKAYEEEWKLTQEYKRDVLQPYWNKLGSCQVVNLPGSHFIHEQKPLECAGIICDFLQGVD